MSENPFTGQPKKATATEGVSTTNDALDKPKLPPRRRAELTVEPQIDEFQEYKLPRRELRTRKFTNLPESTPRARAQLLLDRLENLMHLAIFYNNQTELRVFDTDMAQSALDVLESIFEPRPQDPSLWPKKENGTPPFDRKVVLNPFIDTAPRTAKDQEGSSSKGSNSQVEADEALAKKLAEGPQDLPSERNTNEGSRRAGQMQRVASGNAPSQSPRTPPSRATETALQNPAAGNQDKCMQKIDKQLRELNSKLQWRNRETREAYDCFKRLMAEYREMEAKNGILLKYHEEDTAAIEGLHGTVAAFQDNVSTWIERHLSAAGDRQIAVTRLLEQRELELQLVNTLHDDIKGFMAGWNDAKVEFYSRRDARRQTESRRQAPEVANTRMNPKKTTNR
ncbi:hypothetical protein BJX68DRAFT_75693 [Aspergillus pseudodeflectus]|uniref:Uncharacterized protein n=1 Tax=Aspergillus pseudodeflectus TaxID=176178 RepID=A0ABR4KF86_9EURO